ncbi:MAG: hypothetical protein NXI15_12430 [Gammaproteobacteria bacterium]|nr:hypothetical protein [Gammaproteobacteria bacterium]
MEQAKSSRLVFVVGMHRSGTSAACAALDACGVSFGQELLDPMQGVNEAGFWEASEVVAINEALLDAAGTCWYAAGAPAERFDWTAAAFAPQRARIERFLQTLTASAAIVAVKDPRLCLTLPLWLRCAADLDLEVGACVVLRSPLAVARSLQSRDNFPLGYGLRLLTYYLRSLVPHLPAHTAYVHYEALLKEPVVQMTALAQTLALPLACERGASALNTRLQHQCVEDQTLSLQGWRGEPALVEALQESIEQRYPVAGVLASLADNLVLRGQELQRIGDAHSHALETVAQKDADIARVGDELSELHGLYAQSLAEIARRDRWKRPFRALRRLLAGAKAPEHVETMKR